MPKWIHILISLHLRMQMKYCFFPFFSNRLLIWLLMYWVGSVQVSRKGKNVGNVPLQRARKSWKKYLYHPGGLGNTPHLQRNNKIANIPQFTFLFHLVCKTMSERSEKNVSGPWANQSLILRRPITIDCAGRALPGTSRPRVAPRASPSIPASFSTSLKWTSPSPRGETVARPPLAFHRQKIECYVLFFFLICLFVRITKFFTFILYSFIFTEKNTYKL